MSEDNWPPKLTVTPEGIAGMYLISTGLGEHASKEHQDKLAKLLRECFDAGVTAGIQQERVNGNDQSDR